MSPLWSYGLALLGICGTFVVGRKNALGWLLLIVNETMWTIYSIQSKQYGFLIGSFAYCIVYIKSYRKWRKDERSITQA